jgi:hypothetical protein
MLGFSPFASAPLGDDGVTVEIIYILTADSITTGSPVVPTSVITQDQDLSLTDITSGQPTVSSSAIAQDQDLSLTAITSGQPTVSSSTIAEGQDLNLTAITTGQPTVSSSTIDEGQDLNLTSYYYGATVGAKHHTGTRHRWQWHHDRPTDGPKRYDV